jgi:hypothetical protein
MSLRLENCSDAFSALSWFVSELEYGDGLPDRHEISARVMPDARERPRHRNQANQDEWRKLVVEDAIDKKHQGRNVQSCTGNADRKSTQAAPVKFRQRSWRLPFYGFEIRRIA